MYEAILLDPNYSVDLNSYEDLGKHYKFFNYLSIMVLFLLK